MRFDEYETNALATLNPAVAKDKDMTLLMAVLGLSGESGEVADMQKKAMFHGHPFDRDEMIKELGDVLWYIVAAASALQTSLEEIAWRNIKKLEGRYRDGFSNEASINRKEY